MPDLTQSQPEPPQQKLITPQEDSTKQLQHPVPPNGGTDSQPRPTEPRQESSHQEPKIHPMEPATSQDSPAQLCLTVPAIQKTAEISKSGNGGKDENRWQKLKNKLSTVLSRKNKLDVRKEIISPNLVPGKKQISVFWISILYCVGVLYIILTTFVSCIASFFVNRIFLWVAIWLAYGAFLYCLLYVKAQKFARIDGAKIEYLDLDQDNYKTPCWKEKRADLMKDKYDNEYTCLLVEVLTKLFTFICAILSALRIFLKI